MEASDNSIQYIKTAISSTDVAKVASYDRTTFKVTELSVQEILLPGICRLHSYGLVQLVIAFMHLLAVGMAKTPELASFSHISVCQQISKVVDA